jgi:hypothetical protein
MVSKTHFLRAFGHSGALDPLLSRVPAFDALGKFGTLRFIEESWHGDLVTIRAMLTIDTREPIEAMGVRLAFGTLPSGPTHLPFQIEAPAGPMLAAIFAVGVLGDILSAVEVAETLGAADLSDPDAFFAQFAGDFSAIAFTLGPVPIRLTLSPEFLTPGRHVLDTNGQAIAVEPFAQGPAEIALSLGTATLTVNSSGVGILLDGTPSASLPPLMIAGTGLAIEITQLGVKLSGGPLPPALAALGADRGFDDTWRGLFAEEVVLWNLDKVMPDGPSGDAATAPASRITASGLAIDGRGITGEIEWQRPAQPNVRLALESFALSFDRSWYPTGAEGTGRISLQDIVGPTLGFRAAMELDPFADPDPRWRLMVEVTGFTFGQPVATISNPPPALTALATAGAAALGDGDFALLLAGLAAGARANVLDWQEVLLKTVCLTGDLRPDGFGLSASLGISNRLLLTALPDPVELELFIDEVVIGYDSVGGFSCEWSLADGLNLQLPVEVDIGGIAMLERIALRRRDDSALVIELGIEVDGAGDAAIGGLPNVVSMIYRPGPPEKFNVEFSRDGQELTLLVPGTLYAKGILRRSGKTFPDVGPLPWGDTLHASLTAFIVGNGTAQNPQDHLQKSSYLFALDLGLLTSTRADGLKALVLTGDLAFKPGLPLGSTGTALYGLGLTYAQNAAPAAENGDYTGWFLATKPEFSTAATKWEPRPENWGFGASVTVGSQPDDGRSWNVAAGLFLLLPGPVVMITGKGALFSPPPQLPTGGAGAIIEAPFGAAVALDFYRNRLSAELDANIDITAGDASLLKLQIPARIDASVGTPIDMTLSIGSFAEKDKRVQGTALELFDITTYVVASTAGIDAFPRPGMRLPGFAMAYGGSGGLSAGFRSALAELQLSVIAGFDLGVSLAIPPLLAGRVYIDGSIYARLTIVSVNVGIATDLLLIAPKPFELSGTARVHIGLPWPLPDISFSGDFRIGLETQWPRDYPDADNPISDISLFARPNGAAQLENGQSFDGLVLDAGKVVSGVPVDVGILCAFRAPVGNNDPQIGLVATLGDDMADMVWEVASTGRNDAGDELRYGWRHLLTNIELRENGMPIAASGGWSFRGVSGNSNGADKSGSGGQADRRTLCLLAPFDTPVERRYGTGAEVLTEIIVGWRPCAEPPDLKSYLTLFSIPDRGGLAFENPESRLPTLIQSECWHHLIRHSPFAGPDARVRYTEPLQGVQSGAPIYEQKRPQLLNRPAELSFRIEPALSEQTFVLTLPLAIFSGDADIARVLSSQMEAPCGVLEIHVPIDGSARKVVIALRQGVKLDIRAPDQSRLVALPVPNAAIGLNADEIWVVLKISMPDDVDTITVAAYQTETLSPGAVGGFGAILLGASLVLPYEEREAAHDRRRDAASKMTSDVSDLAKAWAGGSAVGLLKPGTGYELELTLHSYRARQVGGGKIEIATSSVEARRTVRFSTEGDIAHPLIPAMSAPAWAPGLIPPYNLAVVPSPGAWHYLAEELVVEYADAVVAGRIAAHGRSTVLRLTHESGSSVTGRLEQILSEAKAGHSELQDIVAGYIDGQRCLPDLDRDPIWLSMRHRYVTLLEPGRYLAELAALDDTGSRDETLLHHWRFNASRWASAEQHLAAHRTLPILLPGLAGDGLADLASAAGGSQEIVFDDALVDRLLYGILGLAPMPPSSSAVLRIPLYEDGTACLVIDGPEPFARHSQTLSLSGIDGPLAISGIAANTNGSRVIICTQALSAPGDLTLHWKRGALTHSLAFKIPEFASLVIPT